MGDSIHKVIRDTITFIETGVETTYEPFLKFREVPQPLEKRIAIAEKSTKIGSDVPYLEPNCIGTAFFLLGVLPYDIDIYPNKRVVETALLRMQPYDVPRNNSILVLFDAHEEIHHSAFIKTINPFTGFHRLGSCKSFCAFSEYPISEYMQMLKEKHNIEIVMRRYYTLKDSDNLLDWAKERVAAFKPSG